MHEWMDSEMWLLRGRRGWKRSVIAPRESGKSIWWNLIELCRRVVEGRESYVVIISETKPQAANFLIDIRDALETNQEIARHYPHAFGRGPTWSRSEIVTKNGVKIEGVGRGSKIRGRRRGASRPSMFVLDDLQSNDIIASEKQRNDDWFWFNSEVIPAGSDTTNYISLGTAIADDAIANRLVDAPGWTGKRFRAVVEWPDRMDLWDEWDRLYTNMADPDAVGSALAFFERNRESMEYGAVVLWPSFKPLYTLMCRRAEIGPKAFDAEYQAMPSALGGVEWPADYFGESIYFNDWPKLLDTIYSLDPSKGKSDKQGDFQAHVWGGLARDGFVYVDAEFHNEGSDLTLDRMLKGINRLGGVSAAAIESNIYSDLLETILRQKVKEDGVGFPPIRTIENTDPKPIRIRKLDPWLSRKQIRVRNSRGGRMLVGQLKAFSGGEHDDGPDALEMLMREQDRIRRKPTAPRESRDERFRRSAHGGNPLTDRY